MQRKATNNKKRRSITAADDSEEEAKVKVDLFVPKRGDYEVFY